MLTALGSNVAPRLLITMGDVAGIGPEIIAKAWPELTALCRPVVVGDLAWLRWAIGLVGSTATVVPVQRPDDKEPGRDAIPCLPASKQDLSGIAPGRVSAAAGRAA